MKLIYRFKIKKTFYAFSNKSIKNLEFSTSEELGEYNKKGFVTKKILKNLSEDEKKEFIKNLEIPQNELLISYACSSGPGGQHVNKTASKAVVKFNVFGSFILNEKTKEEIIRNNRNRINKEGEITLSFQKYREQNKNLDEAILNLKKIIADSYVEECEDTFQMVQETPQQKKRREEWKKKKSEVKKLRNNKFDF